MGERYLTILEVSQKQAYIFGSNKLRDNIVNSAVIAWVMSNDYFEKTIADDNLYCEEKNYVYSGGGHTILEFDAKEKADEFVKKITSTIRKEYPGIEVFAKTLEYRTSLEAGANIKELTQQLERKKALRESAFHQGSFGVEKIDTNTLKPILKDDDKKDSIPAAEEEKDVKLSPKGYERVYKFGDLGGSKDDSNFIAVVHIDGNAMGKKVEQLYKQHEKATWEEYKKELRKFSEKIDEDFKTSYKEMVEKVAAGLQEGKLKELDLKENNFPVRRIITAGDDICFVCEGRIGIECAVEFIKAINKKEILGENYAACAGVAIVHQKYPFYKAYELAEMLCSNAKKFGAGLSKDGTGRDISAIDWHIEYGEIKDTLEEIRGDYQTLGQSIMNMRPYIIHASSEIMKKEPIRQYHIFKKLTKVLWNQEDSLARGKVKGLRQAIKQGECATETYLKFNKMTDITVGCPEVERKSFITTQDGITRSVLFDAIEVVDAFIALD